MTPRPASAATAHTGSIFSVPHPQNPNFTGRDKLLESLLACIRPEELMYGKLLGTLAIGLSMILFWVGCAAVAAIATDGAIAALGVAIAVNAGAALVYSTRALDAFAAATAARRSRLQAA